jgi:hypothetical protein
MAFPSSALNDSLTSPLDVLSVHLRRHFPSRFLVVNLSERSYDYDAFDQAVVEFRFPGLPAPPLSLLFIITSAVAHWIRADDRHLAVLHCQTGLGRTLVALIAFLLYSNTFDSVDDAVRHVEGCLKCVVDRQLIPSQRRYLDYLRRISAGHTPSTERVNRITHSQPAMLIMAGDTDLTLLIVCVLYVYVCVCVS